MRFLAESFSHSTKATGSAQLMAALLPCRQINRVIPQCSAGPIDCSNLLMEMRGRRSTYWAIWRCYFNLGADPFLHQQSFNTLFSQTIIGGDTTKLNNTPVSFLSSSSSIIEIKNLLKAEVLTGLTVLTDLLTEKRLLSIMKEID